MKTKALQVANYIYSTGERDKIKIQKFVYISFGFYSFFNEDYLFDDVIEAWQFGPVVPNVYRNYDSLDGVYDLNPKHMKQIDRVLKKYKNEKPFKLVDLTHQEGTPWSNNFVEGQKKEIPKREIKEYYRIILSASITLLSGTSRSILQDFAKR